MLQLPDTHYQKKTASISSNDTPFVTPAVKRMLQHKNTMMRASQANKADAIAVKIAAN